MTSAHFEFILGKAAVRQGFDEMGKALVAASTW
jgi:hypothetical protein